MQSNETSRSIPTTPSTAWDRLLTDLADRAANLAVGKPRCVIGIVGPPGGGKSTLARALVARLGREACNVPMDGFHLANAELARLGMRDRKGAPDTFDVPGYLALLRRLRSTDEQLTIYAPEFRREFEESIAGARPVTPDTPIVVTEGNYLLLDTGPWSGVAPLLDESWYVDIDEDLRLAQLVQRHIDFGKSAADAREWTYGSDQRNAELIATTRVRADLMLKLPTLALNTHE
jgi:pantothenate kinase